MQIKKSRLLQIIQEEMARLKEEEGTKEETEEEVEFVDDEEVEDGPEDYEGTKGDPRGDVFNPFQGVFDDPDIKLSDIVKDDEKEIEKDTLQKLKEIYEKRKENPEAPLDIGTPGQPRILPPESEMILDLQTNPIYKTDEGDEISKEKIKKVYELLTPYFWKVHVQIIKDQSRKDFGYVIDLVVEKIAKFIDKFKGEKEDGTKVKFENWLSVVIKRSGLDTGKKSDRKTGEAEKEVEKDNKEYPIAPSAPAAPPGFKLDRRQTKALLNRFIDELPEKIKKLKPEEIEELNKKLNKKEKFNSITAERSGNFLTAVYDFYKTAPGPGGKSNNQWREEAGRKIATAFHSSDHNRDWQAEAMEELGYTDADLRNPKRAVEIEARAEENMLDAFEGRSPASLVDQKAFVDFYLIKRKRFKQIADREATLGTYLDMEVPLEKSKEISELLNSNIEKLEKDKKNINFEKLKDVYLAGYKPNDLLDFETIEELEDYEQEKKYLKDKPSKEEKAEASPTYRSMHVINPTSLARRLKELMPLAKLALMKFEKKDPETVQDIRQRRSVKEAIKEAIMEVLNETEVDNAREENLQETIAEALKDFLKKK